MRTYLSIALLAAACLAVLFIAVKPKKVAETNSGSSSALTQVTFIELGSVNCIPCKAMQPIMRELEKTIWRPGPDPFL